MATLVPNFEITQSVDGKKLYFSETTGVYSSVNTGGYGPLGEFETSDALYAYLYITDTSGTTHQLTVSPTYPTDDSSVILTITGADLGMTANDIIVDGNYVFRYYIFFVGFNGAKYAREVTKNIYLVSQVKCCVSKMFANIDATTCCDDCNPVDNTALCAYGYYKGIIYAAECNQISKANNLLALALKLCNNSSNCNSCK